MTNLRWGIVGCGAVAGLFAEGLAFARGSRLHAVASRSRHNAEGFAARFGANVAYEGMEHLLRDREVDVVYVATPNELHRAHCLLAIEAGKAVLCEKPFALNAAEGREVVEAARRKGVFCMEGMWMRCSPAWREALDIARSGSLGELRFLDAALGFPYEVDPTSRLFSPPGGGALLDLGVYPISLAQAVFGRPVRVQSVAMRASTGVDEQLTAVLEYPGGRLASIAASLRVQLANGASLHGTTGIVRWAEPLYFPHRYEVQKTPVHRPMRRGTSGRFSRLRQQPWARALLDLRARLRTRNVVRRDPGNGYCAEADEVARCLRLGLKESDVMPLDDTLAVLETLDAIRNEWAAPGLATGT